MDAKDISQQLKIKIEEAAVALVDNNTFFRLANQQKISKEQIVYYLINVAYLLHYTPICLHAALAEADDIDLKEYYKQKLIEETGHDQWAFNDLRSLGQEVKLTDKSRISSSMHKLVGYILELIRHNPRYYLLYITVVEYLTVQYGPTLVACVNHCGVSPHEFTAVSNHVELDQDHAHEDFSVIARFFTSNAEWDKVETCVDIILQYISDIYSDIATFTKMPDEHSDV